MLNRVSGAGALLASAHVVLQLIALSPSGARAQQEDFCQSTLCAENVKHVACGQNGAFDADACSTNPVQIDLTVTALRDLLVDKHNEYRNQLATGQLANFPTASSMKQMYWDDTLAYVAAFTARTCRMQHPLCRGTALYPVSGQNLAELSSSSDSLVDRDVIVQLVEGWWAENRFASADIIASFQPNGGGSDTEYGHFTEMAQQKNAHLGCALVRFVSADGQWYQWLLACNYEWNNVVGRPVYETGDVASNCGAGGVSTKYPGLCA